MHFDSSTDRVFVLNLLQKWSEKKTISGDFTIHYVITLDSDFLIMLNNIHVLNAIWMID